MGKRLERFERGEEQKAVLKEICKIADEENVDLILIAGDLFDTFNPPNQAIEDLFQTVKVLSKNGERPVVAIAGNHDSPQRIEAPDPLARANGIIFAGFPDSESTAFELETGLSLTQSAPGFVELKLPGIDFPTRLLLTPYANESRLRKALGDEEEIRDLLREHWKKLAEEYCDDKGVNLLMAHLYMMPEGTTPPDEPEDERPIRVGNASAIYTNCIPEGIQYVAMGHLHRYQNMSGGPCPVVYPSSILAYSFSEAHQKKYVVIGDVEPGKEVEIKRLELTEGMPLERKTFEDINDAVGWLSENQKCYVELTIRTPTYIKGEDRRKIMAAHPRVIGPIPEFTGEISLDNGSRSIDLTQSREELFKAYFKEVQSVEPGEEMMALLEEIIEKEAGR